jgi:uncharacterized protein (DUF952 family)
MSTQQSLPVYHLTPASYYHRQPQDHPYQTETLAEEGFIHCTAGVEKLVEIADLYFANFPDELLALEIDPSQLTSPLLFEPPITPVQADISPAKQAISDPNILFPHIYGPIDRQAIVKCVVLQRDQAGQWQMPELTTDH